MSSNLLPIVLAMNEGGMEEQLRELVTLCKDHLLCYYRKIGTNLEYIGVGADEENDTDVQIIMRRMRKRMMTNIRMIVRIHRRLIVNVKEHVSS